jgi:ABC-2 type transport system ATP-binding protein
MAKINNQICNFAHMSVIVSNLTKIYGAQKALDNVSFSVNKGEILGLLGPNGAGKSTTMKIMTCYLPPSLGYVEVAGYDVTNHPIEVRKHVGYLPEHNPLYLDMYVREYLSFVGNLHGIKGKELEKKVNHMIELTGLTIEQNKKIGLLSKGYRQRVGLAQAIIHDPQVLILDEPTTGLDPNQILDIRQLIKTIGQHKTVILSSHIMQEVQAVCNKVVIINAGVVVANNSVESLKADSVTEVKINAEFETPIDASLLDQLEHVARVVKITPQKFEIVTQGKDIRASIFEMCKTHNLRLLTLTKNEQSLEEVFNQVTQANSNR